MKKVTIGLVGLGLLFANGAEIRETAFSLETANTEMAFELQGGRWTLRQYGAKTRNVQDACALGWTEWIGPYRSNLREQATYSAFGDVLGKRSVNANGGIAVTHADGDTTLALENVKAEMVPDAEGAQHVVFHMKDKAYPFHIAQHFRALGRCDVIETWVEIKHQEEGAVRLRKMDSATIDLPLAANRFKVMSLTGQWASEGQVTRAELARGKTIAYSARSGIRSAFENNQSVMLEIGDEVTEESGRVIGGVLCWTGAWQIEVQRDQLDYVEIRAGAATFGGDYVLDAGKKLVLPKFAFTYTDGGRGQVSRNIHRWARDWRLPNGGKVRPILLNSWEGSYFSFTEETLHEMMDGVKEMGGEMFVLDDGWFGKGKYARDDKNRDRAGLGDWVVNSEKLPHGLDGLAAEAKKRGLKFGFWVEPEMVNTNSWLYEAHPDWTLQGGKRPIYTGRGGTQKVLDLSNPAVRDNIFGQLDALYGSVPELAYIKWDANADFLNMGSAYLDREHQANLWFDYTKGLYDLLTRIRAKYPRVDMQACSSGGGHTDYGFLEYADEFWGSDDSDARERVFIQWGMSHFYPACCMGAHVTAVPNHQTGRSVPLKLRFDVAMSGRMGFELHPKNMEAEELEFAKQCVADYKRIRRTVQLGDLYRIASPYENEYSALMYVNDEKTQAVVFMYGLVKGMAKNVPPPLKISGLNAARRYRISEINAIGKKRHTRVDGKTIGGDALMAYGLPVKMEKDYDSAVIVIDKN